MMGSLLFSVALVANLFVIVICTAETSQAAASSSASAKSEGSSYSSSTARSQSSSKNPLKKCRRVKTKRCPSNEEFSYCPQSIQRPQYCSEKGQSYRTAASDTNPCKEGCVCKENYLRAENGTCVPEEQCPITCGPDELLDNCPVDCETDYCPTSDEDTAACVPPDVCPEPVCKCGFNYRRDLNGSCIPTRKCPAFDCSARPNEEYNPCPPLCPTDDCSQASPSGECPALFGNIGIVLPCNPTCRCIKGYWRLDGVCVPYGECPGVCPKHERYSTCIQGECRTLNCSQQNEPVACPRIDPRYCIQGCVCEEGYLRAENGTCVPANECENTCPVNEEFVPCIQGVCRPMDCSQKGQDVPCPDYPAESCDSGCICKEFFLRAANGTCVPEDECKPQITCSDNEVLDNCANTCTSDYCPKSADEEQVCTQPDTCQQKCKCKFNYRRAENGTCIPTRKCPSFACDRENEEYNSCPPLCPTDDCSLPRIKGQCPYRIGIVLPCNPKCQCEAGYGRLNGTCVPFADCTNICQANEEYSSCIQASCQPQSCSDRDQNTPCPAVDEASCEKGCVCKENYFRNENGDCVSYNECGRETSCGPNQEIRCVQSCPPEKSCRNRGIEFSCLQDFEPCKNKCVCKEGFYRNAVGDCITGEQCDKCQGANEYFTCGGECDNVCSSIRYQNKTVCPIQNIVCNNKCYCDDGYARDKDGKCIPIAKCPPSCSDENEVYECRKSCPPDTCISLVIRPICDSTEHCKKGCYCKPGFLRQKKGSRCIPICECTEMAGTLDCKNQEK